MSNPAHKPRRPGGSAACWATMRLVSVTRVDLSQAEIHDADLAQLENLPRLQSLCLNLNDVGDAGLKHLEGLTRLRELFLWHRHRRLRPGTPQGIDPTPLAESGRQQDPRPRAGEPQGIDPLANPRAQRYGDQRRRPGTPARIDRAPLPLPRRHRGQRHRAEVPQGIDPTPPCTSTVVGSWVPA